MPNDDKLLKQKSVALPPPPPPLIEKSRRAENNEGYSSSNSSPCSESLENAKKLVLESAPSPTSPRSPIPFTSKPQKRDTTEIKQEKTSVMSVNAEFMDQILWLLLNAGVDVLRIKVEKFVAMVQYKCNGNIKKLNEELNSLQPQEIAHFILPNTNMTIEQILGALRAPPVFAIEDAHRGAPSGLERSMCPPNEYYVVTKHTLDANACANIEAAFTCGQAQVCTLSIPSENNFVGEAVFSKQLPQDLFANDISHIHYTLHAHSCKLSSLDRDANKSYRFIADFQSRINKLERTVSKLIDHHRRQISAIETHDNTSQEKQPCIDNFSLIRQFLPSLAMNTQENKPYDHQKYSSFLLARALLIGILFGSFFAVLFCYHAGLLRPVHIYPLLE